MRHRGFEIIQSYRGRGIRLPRRETAHSAGYDIEAAEKAELPPRGVAVIPTGLKAYMQPDEYLGIHIRSGFSLRNRVFLLNGQGVVDADYYNNKNNEGHIQIALINFGDETVRIQKGMRIAQGIFYKYLTSDGDDAAGTRFGGFGSTG